MELDPHVSWADKELKEYFRVLLTLSTLYLVEQFQINYINLGKDYEK